LYGSYIGGNVADEHVDGGTSRFDKNGVVYQSVCAGCGGSSDFPTTAASGSAAPWSSVNNNSNCNNVVYKFSTGLLPVADFIPDQTAGCNDFSVTFANFSSDDDTWLWDFGDGQLDSTTFEPTIVYTEAGDYTVYLYVTDSICLLTDTAEISITVIDSVIINVASPVDICGSASYTLTADAQGTGDYFIWSTSPTMTPALNAPADSSIVVNTSGTYYIEVGNAYCSKVDTVVVNFVDPPTISLDPMVDESCVPFQGTYQVNVTSADSILWDFGGQTLTTESALNTQLFSFDQPGNYTVSISAFNEVCPTSASTSIQITVLDSISISTLNPIYICNNDPYTIVANISGSATNIVWSDQPDFSTQLNDGPNDNDIIVSTSGIYYVTATNGFCSDTSFSEITFDSPAQASFAPSEFLGCQPLTVSFDNTSVQTAEFLWDFGNSTLDSTNFEPTVTYDQPGQYAVTLIIFDPECPAQDTAEYVINVLPDVITEVQDTVVLCASVPVTLVGNTFGTADNFVWSSNNLFSDTLNSSTSDSTLSLSNPSVGYYYFSASNGSCDFMDSVYIYFSQLSIDVTAADSVCFDESTLVTAVNPNPGVNFSYSWEPQSVIVTSSGTVAEVLLASSQYIYVTGEYNGCFATDSVFIEVSYLDSTQVIASASDYVVSPGSTVTLFGNPNGMDTYLWTPDNGLFNPEAQNTEAFIEEDIIYTLSVTNGVCTREDTVEIRVYEVICEDPYVFIPNAFSPNGDGENDVLYVRGIWIEEMIFRIFDRWGELVFESTDPAFGWDGTFRGRNLDPDVYDFYLDVTCVGGLKSITKGNVTLMR
jgi:gliding motility-associated-like protein